MKNITTKSRLYFATALTLTLTACGSDSGVGGGGGGTTSYPSASNASDFPIGIDTIEETLSGDNTPEMASSTTVGATSYHTIYPLGDVDWIKITLNSSAQYEFTVDNVSYNGLPVIDLYESDGATPVTYNLGAGDDSSGRKGYFGNNPRVTFTPAFTGTYYARISDWGGGVNSYTFSTRVFGEADSDTYSPYYDCDDTDPVIYPWAPDTLGHTVDQSCSGYIWPDPTSDDFADAGANDDGDFATAGSIPIVGGDPYDIIHRQDIFSVAHTITLNDHDFYKITILPYRSYDIFQIDATGTALESSIFNSSQIKVYSTGSGSAINYLGINNTTTSPVDYYIEVFATDPNQTATYLLAIGDWGTDADGDGRLTREPGPSWDCNDNDITIHGNALEIPNDGIDSNCNGYDNN